tara:strand:+ start:508 stop:1305 length:798 start_codon:yes stop_codon:yes gene_type:complete
LYTETAWKERMTDNLSRFKSKTTKRTIAYQKTENVESDVTVVFCGGFKSDMQGTKASFLEAVCQEIGINYIRFDYSGHGESEGKFINGTIGDWYRDALSVLDEIVTTKKVILIGSSMGGWISLLAAKEKHDLIKSLILLAPAPDFTREVYDSFSEEQKNELLIDDMVKIPNDYSDEPYIFTRRLIDEGEGNCLLDKTIPIKIPVSIIQGMKDNDVPWEKALKISDRVESEDVIVHLLKHAGHSLSGVNELELLRSELKKMTAKLS